MTTQGNVLITLPAGPIVTVDSADRRELVVDASQVLLPAPDRYFLDELTITGEWYLIPADRRGDWYDFDAMSEHTCEPGPIPDYARPVRFVRHFEFEYPEEVM